MLAGCDNVTYATSKFQNFKQKVQKMKDIPSEGHGFKRENSLKISDEKSYTLLASTKQPHETHDPQMQQLMTDFETTKKNKVKEKGKSIQVKTVGFCETRTKKTSPDVFNFYVVLVDHGMIIDADRATGLPHVGAESRAHHYQKKVRKLRTSRKHGF